MTEQAVAQRGADVEAPVGWRQSLAIYLHPRPLILLLFGFSSGLPLLLVFGTLSFWLREAGVERSTIGFVSWVALAYGFKWVWAPVVDRVPVPGLSRWLGRRRGWLLAAQLAVAGGLAGMAVTDPALGLERLVWLAVLVAFASATQDIVVDAFRIESGGARLQAAMAATYMIGYRLAMITAGAGVLWLAAWVDPDEASYQHGPWQFAYLVMAGLMSVGILTTLFVSEPSPPARPPADSTREPAAIARLPGALRPLAHWLWSAVLSPFIDFFGRYRWLAFLVLALIASYRVSDIVLGVIANVFYVDMGFTKTEVANVTKVFGVVMTLVGAVVGGVLVNRLGVMRILFAGALLAAATNLLFAVLAASGASLPLLIGVVAMDNLSGGLASAAFVAYLSALTNVQYSATQYALFSSVMLLMPKFLGGFSGVLVDRLGYEGFFTLTAVMGVPVLVLVWLAARYTELNNGNGEAET
ncbi:AmpG family muropeptide MFS transporter [Denitromonas iodatirespirans]|uniref:MFS transporter n=1 Tax=Denitromonas iodatirespirans TaxID=2795389 RepID=A0A944D7W0_DENI1|nr:MFS transporter [Denitromonas iodatirespirans]MBT0959946.1 MFS transporter [Denitromonas iodatirespirans]